MIQWRFPSNDHGETKGINDSGIATFRGTPLKSLAREICQNSLDAAASKTVPVKIEFDLFHIPTKNVPAIDTLKDAFNRCLDFWKDQKAPATKDFYTKALDTANKEDCYILRISDFNTVGLTGVRKEINTNWTNLTKSSGASDKKGTAGGSYGIGKYAPFACSDFSTVFYSTYNKDGEKAYQGVSRLVTFKREDGETTQGIGYYGNEKNTPVFEQLQIEPGFNRKNNDFGTDIYIAGYNCKELEWEKNIIVSVLDGFLGAIWKEKLVVKVGNEEISKESLRDIIKKYKDDLTDNTDKYYSVLSSPDTKWIQKDLNGLGIIDFGVLVGDPDAPRRVAMIRQTGMKIMDKGHLPGQVPCVGVMFIEGDELNKKLRIMENPEHTKWQPDRAKYPLKAGELLSAINRFIKEQIEKIISTGGGEEIDAVGVGNYLPDISDNPKDKGKEEVISDKVVEVEKKLIPQRAKDGSEPGEKEKDDEDKTNGIKEKGGDETDWFHNGGNSSDTNSNPQPAHTADGNGNNGLSKKTVSLKNFIPVAVNPENGNYVFVITPNESTDNGLIEVYLSAETQNYEAPIKNVSLVNEKNPLEVKGNTINGIKFVKDQPIRLKVDLDYHEICALEVKTYAVTR